jgi:hypothetical protein
LQQEKVQKVHQSILVEIGTTKIGFYHICRSGLSEDFGTAMDALSEDLEGTVGHLD